MRQLALPILLVAIAAGSPARAAESLDTCSGYIDAIPVIITTPGVWCMRADLSTAITAGNAIAVNANNVTIDCNNFRLGGLGAGPASSAYGVFSGRLNTTVRNCNVRGFFVGIRATSDGGNLVESNRLDGNLASSILVVGDGSTIRGNLVFDTGGSSLFPDIAIGIEAYGAMDIIDNTVTNVSGGAAAAQNYGVLLSGGAASVVRNNRIRGVVKGDGGYAAGIYSESNGSVFVRDNDVQGTGGTNTVGIVCTDNESTAGGNFIAKFQTAVTGCVDAANTVNPN